MKRGQGLSTYFLRRRLQQTRVSTTIILDESTTHPGGLTLFDSVIFRFPGRPRRGFLGLKGRLEFTMAAAFDPAKELLCIGGLVEGSFGFDTATVECWIWSRMEEPPP